MNLEGWKLRKRPFRRVKTESANHFPSANRFSRLRYTENPLATKEKLHPYYLPPSAINFRKIRVHRLVPFGHASEKGSTDLPSHRIRTKLHSRATLAKNFCDLDLAYFPCDESANYGGAQRS
jgi:hypothetical protein